MPPQNNWCTDEGNLKLSILRNGVFAVTGIGVMILYAISGNAGGQDDRHFADSRHDYTSQRYQT